MKPRALVFCNRYEEGCFKRPPPHLKLVKLLPNGNLTCRRIATPAQHDAFLAWRRHAWRFETARYPVMPLLQPHSVKPLR